MRFIRSNTLGISLRQNVPKTNLIWQIKFFIGSLEKILGAVRILIHLLLDFIPFQIPNNKVSRIIDVGQYLCFF